MRLSDMCNFLKYSCIFVLTFLLFPGVFGYPETEMVDGIYLCTKDVDKHESLVSEKSWSRLDTSG